MSASLTDVQSKRTAVKERTAADKRLSMEVDQIAKKYALDEDAPQAVGCFPRLMACGSMFFHRRSAVATSEQQASEGAVGTTTLRATKGGAVMARFVGKGKAKASTAESARIETATQAVEERVESLADRLKLAKQRAMAASRAGKKEEALREMRKVKAAEKQHATAQMALEALERQADALAQTSLQNELAHALASTNKQMKQKSKGLLSFAEKTIDDAVEVADEVEDVAQVFEGLAPSNDKFDDEDLRDELEAMMNEEDGVGADEFAPKAEQPQQLREQDVAAPHERVDWGAFPSAPVRSTKKEDRQALLADAQS